MLAAVFAAVTIGGCAGPEPASPAPSSPRPAATTSAAAASPLVPVLVETLAGWRRSGAPRTWLPANLHEYVGPDAERWKLYQLFDTAVASYDRSDGSIAIVELYRFRAPSDAFGAYSSRRGFDARRVQVGNEGFVTTHSLIAWKGQVVMRIVGRSGDPGAFEGLGRVVASALAEGSSKPEALAFLAGLPVVAGTEIWTREDALGYSIFRDSALAKLHAGDTTIELLRHPAADEKDSRALFEKFREAVTLNAKTIDPVLGVGNEAFFAQDTHLANTLAFRAGSDVVVLRGSASPETFIRTAESIAARLRSVAPPSSAPRPLSVP